MMRTKRFLLVFVMSAFAAIFSFGAAAQDDGYGVFVPIAKYIEEGDADKLSAWFADSMEISVVYGSGNSSRKQATQILKNFFNRNKPSSFVIEHKASRSSMKYALGSLVAGGEKFDVTIFVSIKDGDYKIQQLKIEKVL